MTENSLFTRLNFLGIDDHTRRELAEIWKLLELRMPEIMQGFYHHINAFSEMKAMVGVKQDYLVKRQTEH